jgi:hypothetical protein
MNRDLFKKIMTILNSGAVGIAYFTFFESRFSKNKSSQPNNSADTSDKDINSTSTPSGGAVEVSKTSNTGLSDKQTLDSANVTSATENQLSPNQTSLLDKIESNSLNSNSMLEKKLIIIKNKLEDRQKLDQEYRATTKEVTSIIPEEEKKRLAENVRNSEKLDSDIQEDLKKVIEFINSNGRSGGLDFINMDDIYKLISVYQDFLHSLTPEQFYAVLHIITGSFILICIFNVISTQFGIFIINYFKIAEKYPKLAKIIELRNKFQRYYFIFNCLMIILAACMMIVTNIIVIFF